MTRFYNRRLRSLILLALAVLLMVLPLSLSGCRELFEVSDENSELNLVLPQGGGYSDAINAYRALYPEVTLSVTHFNMASETTIEELSEQTQQYKMEIMAGKGPDVLFNDLLNGDDTTDMYKVVRANAFADMNEFMDNDPDFHKEDYQEAALKSGEFQGKQFLVPLYYVPNIYITTRELVDKAGIDFEKASQNWLELMRETVAASENPENHLSVFYSHWAEFELQHAANIPFLDYGTNTLDMSRAGQVKEAIRLNKAYLPYVPPHNPQNTDTLPALVAERAVFTDLFSISGSVSGTFDVLLERDMHPLLFPLKNVDGQRTAIANCNVGINNGSRNKQNAWNFIKILLGPQSQSQYGKDGYWGSLPVHKETCAQQLTYYDEKKTKNPEVARYIEELKELIAAPEAAYTYDRTGYMEIYPYMEDYLEGRAGLDEAFDTALDRMERYLSE